MVKCKHSQFHYVYIARGGGGLWSERLLGNSKNFFSSISWKASFFFVSCAARSKARFKFVSLNSSNGSTNAIDFIMLFQFFFSQSSEWVSKQAKNWDLGGSFTQFKRLLCQNIQAFMNEILRHRPTRVSCANFYRRRNSSINCYFLCVKYEHGHSNAIHNRRMATLLGLAFTISDKFADAKHKKRKNVCSAYNFNRVFIEGLS